MTDDHPSTANSDVSGDTLPVGATSLRDASQMQHSVIGSGRRNLAAVMRIPVPLKVVIGSTTLSVAALAKLATGDIVTLDQKVGDKVDVVANGRVIARGEIVVIEGEVSRFGVRIDDVIVDEAKR